MGYRTRPIVGGGELGVERQDTQPRWLDRVALACRRRVHRASANAWRRRRFARRVRCLEPELQALSEAELSALSGELRERLRAGGLVDRTVARAFALVREVSRRVLGQRHYDVQIMGGWVLLRGMLAEMETGEGKTLTAALASCTAALAGIPVHVITVNDYLTRRDAEWLSPIYDALGLRVGVVTSGLSPQERRSAYDCDVVHCTNKEVAFDYLRDRIRLAGNRNRLRLKIEHLFGDAQKAEGLVLRGLHFAIVDEADSVLIDEARTPLIISSAQDAGEQAEIYSRARVLAQSLKEGQHYRVDPRDRQVEITAAGAEELELFGKSQGGVWVRRRLREDLVRQALTADHLFVRDRHYLVRDGKVQIIDEYTGRTMPDRSWEQGLHQAIEVKEGCSLTAQKRTVARISYQRFFRRYLKLAGMTGTASEVAGELGQVYDLPVVRIPTNRPVRRTRRPDRVYVQAGERWESVVRRIEKLHRHGRPVLVGTRSVEASEHLSARLEERGLAHRVLNARQDQHEADVIAQAGKRGSIMVATNMAGRGTDIRLEPGVSELGGLHVIATERHEAARIDRQLFGRCGRQGDRGSCRMLVSLDDEIVTVHAPKLRRALLLLCRFLTPSARHRVGAWAFRRAQRKAERRFREARKTLLRMDEYQERTLAFSGTQE